MLQYDDILKNDYIINEYSKIDKINPYAFSHGLQHINNVCNIMKELCNVLNIDKEMKEALLIACALHDVGQADGRENHGLKAKIITQKLFDEELKKINIMKKYYIRLKITIRKVLEMNHCFAYCLNVQIR